MFEFLKLQYEMGRINSENLKQYVDVGCISQNQYEEIIKGGAY